ncbi:MAG: hypothetical protein NW201_08195 [Gemmatimonadales bacterium]|nr:hypothetical protein [Gemmatimonadales bacterium]
MAVNDPLQLREDRGDLGLGRVLANTRRQRLLNRDGTVNSRKIGLAGQAWHRAYQRALDAEWPRFLTWVAALLLLANGVFALAWIALGPAALAGGEATGLADPFLRALFFSIATFTTASTGAMHPVGLTAHWVAALETLAGVFVLVTLGALMLARLTRPRAQVRFSLSMVVAPYRGGRALMFRMINTRPSEMIDVEVRLNVGLFEMLDGQRVRRFHNLALERSKVEFFTLHWVIVHPLDERSPLRDLTPDTLRDGDTEFFVLVTGLEEMFSTMVHARTSYRAEDVRFDAKFADMFVPTPDGVVTVDVERLDRTERA